MTATATATVTPYRLRQPPRSPRGERGSATVLVLGLLGVLLLVGATALAVSLAVVARHRADAAADLAVLAAAGQVLDGETTACRRAEAVAAGNGARLSACRLSGDVVDLEVEVALPGRLAGLGPARSRARAGPALGKGAAGR